jgi:DNA-binding transcriptional LysR family regulator
MDLRKLRHAVVIAEEGSFARSARRLGLTQPALSRSIQGLEATLGLRLFDRTGAGAHPTQAGTLLLDHAHLLLREEARLRNLAVQLARGDTGRVVFGISPMLTPALGTVLAAVAGVGFEGAAVVHPLHVLEELLFDEKLDFFIGDTRAARKQPELAVEQFGDISIGFHVRASHPLLANATVVRSDLDRYPVALGDEGLVPAGARPIHAFACDDGASLKHLVLAGNAIMLGTSLAVEPELSSGQIGRLSVEGLPGGFTRVGLVHRAGRTLAAGARRIAASFAEFLAPFAERTG